MMNLTLRYLCSVFVSVALMLSSFKACNAEDENSDYYTKQYSYNIFTANAWDLSPYVFAGYSFGWVPYANNSNIEYGNMLRNGHNGFILGAGLTINRNWSFGLSFQTITKKSKLRDSYALEFKEIKNIKSEILLANIDMGLRLPFYKNIDLQVLTGLNIISSNISNVYYADAETVPVRAASYSNKVGFGANVGLAFTYRIFAGLHFKIECRRLFIFKKNFVKDIWLLNTGIGFNF